MEKYENGAYLRSLLLYLKVHLPLTPLMFCFVYLDRLMTISNSFDCVFLVWIFFITKVSLLKSLRLTKNKYEMWSTNILGHLFDIFKTIKAFCVVCTKHIEMFIHAIYIEWLCPLQILSLLRDFSRGCQ